MGARDELRYTAEMERYKQLREAVIEEHNERQRELERERERERTPSVPVPVPPPPPPPDIIPQSMCNVVEV